MKNEKEILGIGWEFPPRFNQATNTVSMLVGKEDVENSIEVILQTKLGERILRSEFGSEIHDLLFEPLNATMKTYMASSLRDSLAENEPRITVEAVDLVQPNPGIGRVDISVRYRLIGSNQPNNLVVPFYAPDNLYLNS